MTRRLDGASAEPVLRALLVDDEAPARSELRYLLAAHADVEVVGEAATAAEALAFSAPYDVVFLDVEMPGATGLETAPHVHEQRDSPAVVFVTAHAEYAVDAFAVEAFDYLLKPVDPDRLTRVLERLRERTLENSAPVERVAVVAGAGTELLEYDQIHFVQADGDYSRVHTYDRSYLSTASLGELEERLGTARFARIHRSYLVNLGKVAGVRRISPDRIRLQLADADRTELDVARRQSREIRDRLGL
jgi:two-component system, LytTR family, response regulator LytT